MHEAKLTQRVKNHLYDSIICGFIALLLFLAFSVYSLDLDDNQLKIAYYGIFLVVRTIYFTVSEYYLARSLGKIITKTKVVTKDNMRASFSVVLVRSLCRLIPLNAFSFIFGLDFHDRFSKTKVILA